MNINELLILALEVSLGGAVLAWVSSKIRPLASLVGSLAGLVSGALAVAAAVGVLTGAHPDPFVLWDTAILGSALRFHVDGLSALFLGLIGAVAFLASLYSLGYMRGHPTKDEGGYWHHFLLFSAGMYGIVTVTDMMLFFCLFWQLMTLPSFALVRFERTKEENRRAAKRYLVMMELSCALVMLSSALLAPEAGAGGLARYDFESLSAVLPALLAEHAWVVSLGLLLALVGFGIKAGIWPFGQLWLPDAHPAAPSPVSALLSGVMIKTGIYGLVRTFIYLVPVTAWDRYPALVWGTVLSVLGTVTLFVGTIQALRQEQSKRLLAFHSIGQVGYIVLGLGASVALLAGGREAANLALANLALIGALFHTLNHGLFKSLLFFNAGSVLHATGTQDLNQVGGLMKYMPLVAWTTLIAAFSISGVPLFNGFASKWSIYVATVIGSREVGYLAIAAVFAILTSALTLASFMKFFGVVFLSRTSDLVRAREREGALKTPITMALPQALLAAACLALGLVPAWGFAIFEATLGGADGKLAQALAARSPEVVSATEGLHAAGGRALFVPLVVLFVIALLFLLARSVAHMGGATRRKADAWLCGYARETDFHRYGAHHLYGEVKRLLRWAGGDPRRIPHSRNPTAENGKEQVGTSTPRLH